MLRLRSLHRLFQSFLPLRKCAIRRRHSLVSATSLETASRVEHLEQRLVLDVSAPAILQIFESTYENIEDRTADIFAAGYGSIWVPPTGRADSGGFSVGYDVFNRFDLGVPGAPTLYGTETGLKTTIDVLHKSGTQIYVDFVMNHNGFRDSSTPGFVEAGGYPGFTVTLDGDIDGDFHGAFDSGDLNGRLSGLIDIDQSKNHSFIRNPVDPADPNNIPAGTVNNVADHQNARFYPDRDLSPMLLFNPITGQSDIPVYPFNTADPLAGDAVEENALGLLMRNAQWLVQEIGVDGFRLDAAKHFETFVLEFFDQAVYRSNQNPLLDGSTQHVFSFSEVFDGDRSFQQSKIRKDIDPGDPGRIGGNRDVLDFPLFFSMRDNLTDNGLVNDWRNIKNSSQDFQDDGLSNNGSQGVAFASSHDENGPFLSNVAHAYTLMRPGNAVVYFNAEQFGPDRDFPKDGRGDALGGQFGDAIPTLVDIRNTHGRGDYIDRTPASDEKEMLIFERSASSLTVLSNRLDPGFDERTVATNFLPGTPLIELTGNAANPVIDPFSDFPEVLVVNPDGTVNLRVPRNVAPDGTQHNSGYFIYGASGPQGTLSLTNVSSILGGEAPTPATNGTARLADIDVISADSFDVVLDTLAVNHLGSIRDQFADGDNALLKIDGGLDLNGNGAVDFTAPGNVSYGFEEFTTLRAPGFFEADGLGAYSQTIDATQLSEGQHFLEVLAFRHREPGEGDAVYTPFRRTLYVDRLPPESEIVSFDPSVQGINENRQLRARSVDLTADNVHLFLDLPSGLSDAEVRAMVNASSQTDRLDRDLFSKDFNGLTHGNHVATIVTFEVTGNVNVQRVPGLFVDTIFGAGLGDLDFDGDTDSDDFTQFAQVLGSGNLQFNPAADFTGDGLVDLHDLPHYHQLLLANGASQQVLDDFDAMVIGSAPVDYGDAPANYATLQANAGAHHILGVGPFLGAIVDADSDGQPTTDADGDDDDGTNDDDGVIFPATVQAGETVTVPVVASGSGLLNTFIDLNQDGDFEDAGERLVNDLPVDIGANDVPLTISQDALPGSTVVRFRLSTYPGVGATGLASDGEVEDYSVQMLAAPLLDIDGNGTADAATDGILAIRHLFEFTDDALINNAIGAGATNTTGQQVTDALNASTVMLDADGNGVRDAATDGILIIRFLFEFNGDALVNNAMGAGATRTTGQEVFDFLSAFKPPAVGGLTQNPDAGASASIDNITVSGLSTGRPGFQWNEVFGTDYYRIRITRSSDGELFEQSLSQSALHTAASTLSPGNYRIWIDAINASQTTAIASGWLDFSIAEVDLESPLLSSFTDFWTESTGVDYTLEVPAIIADLNADDRRVTQVRHSREPELEVAGSREFEDH